LTRRARALLPVAAAAALAGCAGARPAGPVWSFPEAFDATQAVSVRGAGPARDLVASLRRRGGDYEVTLFDPIFGAPLLSAARRGGQVSIEASGPAAGREAEARRLVEVLADVYGGAYPAPRGGASEGRAGRLAVRLSGVAPRDGCPFPERVDVSARGVSVEVRTLDVTCSPPLPPAP
jgi:hypothetical protein